MLRIKQLFIAASLCSTLFALPVFATTTKQVCSSGAVTIPSNDPNGGISSLSVAETGTITKVRLTGINIKHDFIGEISAYLTHGTKTVTIGDDPGVVAVTSPQGCKGKNITNLTISDTGDKSIETDCTMSDPAYNPSFSYTPSSPLSAFNNDDVSGTWSLKIVDRYNYDSVAGSLDSWCLEYTRPTNSTFNLSPAEGSINLGTATYPTGVTQEIIIQANSGDDFKISRVEFLSVSTGAENDFIGTVTRELPAPVTTKTSSIKSGSPYTSVITLVPNDKYKFSALCKPTGTGTRTATFQITTNLPAPNDILSFPLSCDGNVGLYSSTLAANANVDLGSTALNNTLTSSFTVSNTGTYALTLNESLSADDTDIDIQSPTFPLNLAANTSQTITMKCTPTVAGALSRKLTLSSNNTPNLSSVDYNFTCAGNAPVAQFTPSSGTVNVGTVLEGANKTTKVIDVKNNNGFGSNAVLNLSGATITGTHAGAFSVVNLPTNIPGNTADLTGIKVKCDATGLTGAPITGTNYTATLTLNTNDTTKSTVNFTLSCLVKKPEPIATFSPAPTTLNFNTVGSAGGVTTVGIANASSATKDLTVTSQGFTPTSDAIAFELLDANGHVIADNTSVTIAIGINSLINVRCKGNVSSGTYHATLNLTTDDPNNTTVSYPVSCTVSNNNDFPLYESDPAPSSTISLGTVQVGSWTSEQTIQVSEIGNATLKVDLDSLSNGFEVTSPTFPFTITDGGVAVPLKVRCKPSSSGTHTGTLKLKATTTSDVAVNNYPDPTYTLSCSGVVPTYSSNPAPSGTVTVGATKIGQSNSTTLSISNISSAATSLIVNTPTIDGTNSNDFVVSGLPLTVAQNESAKTITVTCIPTGLNARTATLHLHTNDPAQLEVEYTLGCTGQEAIGTVYSSNPPVIKTAGIWSGVIDFGDVATNGLAQKSLIISEAGSTILNVGEGTPFLTGDAAITVDNSLFISDASNALNPGFFIQNGGSSKTIPIRCQPTTMGLHTATLTLHTDDNDVTKSTVHYLIQCNGVKAGYSSQPAPSSTFSCGGRTTTVGSSTTDSFTISEIGNINLQINSLGFSGANASEFSVLSPAFPLTITDGTTTPQEVKVQFSPIAAGTRTATLTLSSNDTGNSPVSYQFSCQAATPPPPVIAARTLSVAANPSQGGVVQDNLGQIRCGKGTTACSGIFDINTVINLSATAATGYQFKTWTGDCATGSVILNANKTCTANFEAITTPVIPTDPSTPTDPTQPIDPKPVDPSKPTTPTQPVEPNQPNTPTTPTVPTTPETPTTGTDYTISVTTTGKGAGKVNSSEITCQNQQCSQTVAANSQITLVAQPVAGSTFLGWSGSCSGKTAIITVNITEHKQCIARFEPLASELEKEDDGLGNYCTGAGYTNIHCNARGAVIADLNGKIDVDTDGYLSNGIVTKPLTNKGWVANLTIEDTGSLTGGIVTGSIINHGEMSDFEFRGDLLSGGKLSGVIKNNAPNVCFSDGMIRGVIKNVELSANTHVLGGRLSGKIIGDAQRPAHLSNVTLTGATVLQNVILENTVTIEQDVNLETTRFVQVKLAPNVKINGGKIYGELHGDVTAPAQLDNVLLSAHASLENVIFGEKVEIADEKTCDSQQLDSNDSQNSSETVPAILLTSDGKQQNSATTFTPQLTASQGQLENRSVLSTQEATAVNLAINVTVQSEHLGQAADVLVVAQHQATDKTTRYMKTAQGWQLWNGQLSDLQPLQSYEKLPPIFDISVFSGDLSPVTGELQIYAGYRLQQGDVIFNGLNPLHFAISTQSESCALTCGCQ